MFAMIVLPATVPPPAVWFTYSPDRKGEHPEQHLREFWGTLQADAYAGFDQLYADRRIHQPACWAHVRCHFHDLKQADASPIAQKVADGYLIYSGRADPR